MKNTQSLIKFEIMNEEEHALLEEQLPELVTQEIPDQPSDKESSNAKNDYSQWIVGKNNMFIPSEEIITTNKLIPSRYKLEWSNSYDRWCFVKEEINSDELLKLPSPVFQSIINDIEFFWNNKHLFDKYQYVHKRGILLYGTAGCGKTCLCSLLSDQVIQMGGIVLSISNSQMLEAYSYAIAQIFRFIEPNTKILTIFEDLDGLVRSIDAETKLLNILDGNNQLNNVVNIGCTNYPENLKDRILNRPSRFDRRYEIGLPNAEMREYYFRHKINENDYTDESISEVVVKTDGLTLAHLGEFIKSVYIFGKSMDETIAILKGMSEFISSKPNMESSKKIGFNANIGNSGKNFQTPQTTIPLPHHRC